MSYSGRKQIWCANGHYHVRDCRSDDMAECTQCHAPIVFANGVDDTNGEAWGYIKPAQAAPAVAITCDSCGRTHIKEPPKYAIPTKDDRKTS